MFSVAGEDIDRLLGQAQSDILQRAGSGSKLGGCLLCQHRVDSILVNELDAVLGVLADAGNYVDASDSSLARGRRVEESSLEVGIQLRIQLSVIAKGNAQGL